MKGNTKVQWERKGKGEKEHPLPAHANETCIFQLQDDNRADKQQPKRKKEGRTTAECNPSAGKKGRPPEQRTRRRKEHRATQKTQRHTRQKANVCLTLHASKQYGIRRKYGPLPYLTCEIITCWPASYYQRIFPVCLQGSSCVPHITRRKRYLILVHPQHVQVARPRRDGTALSYLLKVLRILLRNTPSTYIC